MFSILVIAGVAVLVIIFALLALKGYFMGMKVKADREEQLRRSSTEKSTRIAEGSRE